MKSSAKPITLAYSPDTDDAFMVHALREGLVDTLGYQFECTSADIQVLNEAAQRGVYDVSAISIASYPAIAGNYLLMPIGASIGDEFGPALVVRPDSQVKAPAELAGKRVAIPGRQTSAYFAARSLIGPFIEVPLGFLEIGPAVLAGEVDAGILIHELQLAPEDAGLRKIGDLGKLWWERHQLPLPLGANAIRRSLGATAVREVTGILRASIEYGLKHRHETLTKALASSMAFNGDPTARSAVGKGFLDHAGGDRYISMYVNHRSLAMAADVRQAISQLFAGGAAAGLCPPVDLAGALYD